MSCCCSWPSLLLALPDSDMSGGMSLLLLLQRLRIMMLVLARWREEANRGLGRCIGFKAGRGEISRLLQGLLERRHAVPKEDIIGSCCCVDCCSNSAMHFNVAIMTLIGCQTFLLCIAHTSRH
jgi:hypothetical protein